MVRERQAVRSVGDLRAWEARWPEHLSGRAAQEKIAAARPPAAFRRASTVATRPGL
jgi:hypothetical protein